MSTGFSDSPTSSTKRNWSISSSKDSRKEVVSSSAATGASRGTCCKGITSWGGICWTGSLTGGRSLRAKKVGLDTSMRCILGSPALMAWPISWKTLEMGSKSKIRWTTHSWRSSLTKICDRGRWFNPTTLVWLSRGFTNLLSAINSRERSVG